VAAGGKALAAAVVALWPRIAADSDQRLAAVSVTAVLPAPGLELRNCLGRWIPRGTRLGLRAALPPSAEVWAVAIGRGAWVAIPGEPDTRLGQAIKSAGRASFTPTLVAGVSNAYQGYLLSADHFRTPSYISCGSLYGERGGEMVRDAAIASLRELAERRAPRPVRPGR